MTYIVTGGLGFIGSEICRQLLDRSKYPNTEKVVIIDNNCKGYGTTKIEDLLWDERLDIKYWDLSYPFPGESYGNFTQHPPLDNLLKEADYIINCAAMIGGIGYFNKIPAIILRDNNLIQSSILDALVRLPHKGRPHYIQMSSSMVFEAADTFPSKESDIKTIRIPITSYGFSKLSCEYYCQAFAQQYDIRYTIVRPFNAVGPERPDPNFVGYSHVLPDLVCKIKNGQGTEQNPLEILGNGKQVRHYTDVREVADGILIATHSPKAINEDFNIAIEKGHTVIEVAELVWQSMKRLYFKTPFTGNPTEFDKLYIKNVDGFKHDVMFRSPDITKTQEILGWKAKTTLEDNIDQIVQSVLDLIE